MSQSEAVHIRTWVEDLVTTVGQAIRRIADQSAGLDADVAKLLEFSGRGERCDAPLFLRHRAERRRRKGANPDLSVVAVM